jgi:hypothetical protein
VIKTENHPKSRAINLNQKNFSMYEQKAGAIGPVSTAQQQMTLDAKQHTPSKPQQRVGDLYSQSTST